MQDEHNKFTRDQVWDATFLSQKVTEILSVRIFEKSNFLRPCKTINDDYEAELRSSSSQSSSKGPIISRWPFSPDWSHHTLSFSSFPTYFWSFYAPCWSTGANNICFGLSLPIFLCGRSKVILSTTPNVLSVRYSRHPRDCSCHRMPLPLDWHCLVLTHAITSIRFLVNACRFNWMTAVL